MRILDRYIVRAFLINCLLALAVLVGMITLFDLIVNFRGFAEGAAETPMTVLIRDARQNLDQVTGLKAVNIRLDDIGLPGAADASTWAVLSDITDYYAFQMLVIFQQVAGVVPLLAAGFTMVRMTRHRELTAMLASGVSLYRVAAPVVVVSMLLGMLNIINQELVISQPYIVEKLLRKHDEVNQTAARADALNFVVDRDNALLSARIYDHSQDPPIMKDIVIVQRDQAGMPISHTFARWAEWRTPDDGTRPVWILHNVIAADDRATPDPATRPAAEGDILYYQTSLTPEQLDLISQKKAVDYLSSAQVAKLITYSPEVNRPMLEKIMHLRFTQPLVNIIMLLLGIPFLLTREPNRLVVNMFYCIVVVGAVFITTFVIFQMAGTKLDPMLAAWLPVLIFGPFALVMLDFIRT